MKQAVILAAGEGRRLKPFTVGKPKAMLSIAGKPIIQYILESLAKNGIRDIILIVGYKRDQVLDYVSEGTQFGVEVRYITQDKQLGTANALAKARGVTDKEFLVLSGDKLIAPETIAHFVDVTPESMLVRRVENPSRYGVVKVEKGKISSIVEKPTHPESNIINMGIYAFSEKVFDYMELELDIPDAINKMLVSGLFISAIESNETWMDVVYPWDILNLNEAILKRVSASHNGTIETGVVLKGPVSIGKGTVIKSNSYITGPVVIGDGCEVGPNVCVFPSTSIANNVVISPFSEIKNSVISDDVHIGSSSTIQDSVIDKGCLLGAHFCACTGEADVSVDFEHYQVKLGAMLGEDCHINHSVTAQSGAILGNHSQVRPFKLIYGRFPERSIIV